MVPHNERHGEFVALCELLWLFGEVSHSGDQQFEGDLEADRTFNQLEARSPDDCENVT